MTALAGWPAYGQDPVVVDVMRSAHYQVDQLPATVQELLNLLRQLGHLAVTEPVNGLDARRAHALERLADTLTFEPWKVVPPVHPLGVVR